MRCRKWLIHSIARCCECDFVDEDYTTSQKTGRAHARKTGHTVDIDTGYTQTYNEKEK